MNTLIVDNAKEFYKRNKKFTDEVIKKAITDLESKIKDADEGLTLDSYETRRIARYLLINKMI